MYKLKKASMTVFKSFFIGILLFFLNSTAFGGLGDLPTVLNRILSDLRINTETLSPYNIRFLEDSLEQKPSWMLKNKKARKAIFGIPSSKVDEAYRKLFYSRLDPHSDEEMLKFFEALEDYQLSIHNQLLGRRGGAFSSSSKKIQHHISAWKKATRGILYAIDNGDFNISLSDFHALRANHVSEVLKEPNLAFTNQTRLTIMLQELLNIFQATSKQTTQRVSTKNVDPSGIVDISEMVDSAIINGNYNRALEIVNSLPKREDTHMKAIERTFLSPFYKPSSEAVILFKIAAFRGPVAFSGPILENANLILRLWTSGIGEHQSIIRITLKLKFAIAIRKAGVSPEEFSFRTTGNNSMAISSEKAGEAYRYLGEDEFFKALNEASMESEGITSLIQDVLKPLDSGFQQGPLH